MKKREPPTPESFEKLLLWLNADREKAAEIYYRIHTRLVRIFSAKGCAEAEDLADETVNVVTSKVDWLRENYVGDPARYFYGVANKIYREYLKSRLTPVPPPIPDKTVLEIRCGCLEKCLNEKATAKEREIMRGYHEGEGRARIENRKQLAEELGITVNALRIQICHLQARMRPCVEKCFQKLER